MVFVVVVVVFVFYLDSVSFDLLKSDIINNECISFIMLFKAKHYSKTDKLTTKFLISSVF